MNTTERQIKIHRENITNLINKLNETSDINEQIRINDKIKTEQEFLCTLYDIYKNLVTNYSDKNMNNKDNQKNLDKNKFKKDNNKKENLTEKTNELKNSNKIEFISKNKKDKSKNKLKSKSFDAKRNKIEKEIKIDNMDPRIHKSFKYYFINSDILSTFYIKKKNKNTIYFECGKKRQGCIGKIKFNINENKWYLQQECKDNISHETSNFLDDKFEEYNMNIKKIQKFYARAMLKSNNSTDINTVRSNFKNKFNFKISLTNQEISKEKNNALGGFSKLDHWYLQREI